MECYKDTNVTLYLGNAKDELKLLKSDSIDLIATDPPYGIAFMGKQWDINVPHIDIWKECLRVLKSGAFAFILSSPRQDVLSENIVRLRQAGFDTNFTSIYWTYASGFPKAMNIGKSIDKRLGFEPKKISPKNYNSPDFSEEQFKEQGSMMYTKITSKRIQTYNTVPSSNEAKILDGSYAGFQPKPALEVIIVAMKPISEKTFIDQALNNGKGVTWLDNCRIPFQNADDKANAESLSKCFEVTIYSDTTDKYGFANYDKPKTSTPTDKGRFPANLLVSDDVLNNGKITESPCGNVNRKPREGNVFTGDSCGFDSENNHTSGFGDFGSYSRYFDLDKWFEEKLKTLPENVQKTFPFLIVPKPSISEKNENVTLDKEVYNDESRHDKTAIGCNNPRNRSGTPKNKNSHPTVKPIKLMSYLVTLGSRTGDIILDPFAGSGTTCIAANMLGRKAIGIDNNKDYIEIATLRVKEYSMQVRFV